MQTRCVLVTNVLDAVFSGAHGVYQISPVLDGSAADVYVHAFYMESNRGDR